LFKSQVLPCLLIATAHPKAVPKYQTCYSLLAKILVTSMILVKIKCGYDPAQKWYAEPFSVYITGI